MIFISNKLYKIELNIAELKEKIIKGKYHYYVQLIMEGIPPIKINKDTGEIKNPVNNGTVGIDIGTQTIACSFER